MSSTLRHQKLMEIIATHGECSIDRLARELGVSDMTIRRDLQTLSEDGKVLRTHGGAAATQRVSFEFEFLKQIEENRKAKQAIARLAATHIEDGQSVLLDSGTTTLALAEELRHKRQLTVVTTSLPIASKLQFSPQITVLLLGGYVRNSSPDLAGALTESNLETLSAEVAFVGAAGIDRQGGVYQHSPEIARLLSKMVQAARKAYVLADSSKFDKTPLCRCGHLKDWAGLFTDGNVPPDVLASLRKIGVATFVA